MRRADLERRLRRLEGRGKRRRWPSDSTLCTRFAEWLAHRHDPRDRFTTELLLATGAAVLAGLRRSHPKYEHSTPKELTVARLLTLFRRGGSCEFDYLGSTAPPAEGPLPRAWRSVARDLERLHESLPPRPPAPLVDDNPDWIMT